MASHADSIVRKGRDMNKLAEVDILGGVVVAIVGTFIFLTVASVLDTPGIRNIPNDQLIGTIVTLTAAIGGAAAARFGGSGKGDGPNA